MTSTPPSIRTSVSAGKATMESTVSSVSVYSAFCVFDFMLLLYTVFSSNIRPFFLRVQSFLGLSESMPKQKGIPVERQPPARLGVQTEKVFKCCGEGVWGEQVPVQSGEGQTD